MVPGQEFRISRVAKQWKAMLTDSNNGFLQHGRCEPLQ